VESAHSAALEKDLPFTHTDGAVTLTLPRLDLLELLVLR
jgi:hypothetical protein